MPVAASTAACATVSTKASPRASVAGTYAGKPGNTAFPAYVLLRDTEHTIVPFCILSSGHLCRSFNRKILYAALLGWFRQINIFLLLNGQRNQSVMVLMNMGHKNPQYIFTCQIQSFLTDSSTNVWAYRRLKISPNPIRYFRRHYFEFQRRSRRFLLCLSSVVDQVSHIFLLG